jgi:hypothetical protein
MTRIFTLFVLSIALLSSSSLFATNYKNYGSNSTYQLYSGDTLRIMAGTYGGTIAVFNNNSVIIVEAGAHFRPIAIPAPKGLIINSGNVDINSSFAPGYGFSIQNFNITSIANTVQMNGLQTWYNKFGATMTFEQNIEMNAFSYFLNEGTLDVQGKLDLNFLSSFENKNNLSTGGSLTINMAEFDNSGELNTGGMLTFNFGASFTNECRMITKGGFTNNCYSFINKGLLYVGTTNTNADHFVNNGTFTNGPNAVVRAVRFTNNSTINGSGSMYFTGETINYGTIGTYGTTSDSIRVYDVSRTSASRIFDIQYGTVRNNVVYRTVAAPDTSAMLGTCSNLFKTQIALPIKYSAFFVNLSDNTPMLNWASQQTEGTVFEVQRSFNGTNFNTIATINATEGTEAYKYVDNSVNGQSSVVYYRIMGIELNGLKTFTEVRLVKFSNNQGVTIQTAPNPFTSQFSINYQSTSNETITIKMYNMNGQQQNAKVVSVARGFNSISVTGISNLPKGIYLVQVANANGVIASERMVKQ